MIEQTELVISDWIYTPPANASDPGEKITSYISLDVMKKRAANKKGIACRFTCKFMNGEETILVYIGEDSYVIDLPDVIDKNEVLTMIRNSYSKFKEKFDFRKLGSILQYKSMTALDESKIDVNAILPLLI